LRALGRYEPEITVSISPMGENRSMPPAVRG
jgi:hypothetical protein